jgi:glycosyltransferase involved in cell wall biosynthesis
MRVLIATDHFPPFIGGAHRWASLLAQGLARRGHDVAVATMWHGGLPRLEHHGEQRIEVHRIRQLRTPIRSLVRDRRQRHAPPFADPVSAWDLRHVIRAVRPDVVLSHGWITTSVIPALWRSGTPLIASAHDYGNFCATRQLLERGRPCSGPEPLKCLACAGDYYGGPKGWVSVAGVAVAKRITRRRISAIQSVTSYVDEVNARFLLGDSAGGRAVRRYIVPAFVDTATDGGEDEEQLVQRFVAQLPDEPFILFVGALRPVKGVYVLFDAYRRLENPPPLVLLGTVEVDTPEPFPTGAIVITDVPHPAVAAAWKRALIGVVPSVWPEPLGTVSVEGITYGVPVIASEPSGMVDVVGDGAGVLVPRNDAVALADAMRSLIDDPARREAISRVAAKRAIEFGAEAVLTRYEQMLAEVAAAG